jgi:hypothetical protein
MLSSTLLIVVIAAIGTAQSTTSPGTTASPSGPVVSLFLPDTDPQQLVASVVGSSGPMTTYVIACPESVDPSDCGYNGGINITEGASSLHLSQVRGVRPAVYPVTYLFIPGSAGLDHISGLHLDGHHGGCMHRVVCWFCSKFPGAQHYHPRPERYHILSCDYHCWPVGWEHRCGGDDGDGE